MKNSFGLFIMLALVACAKARKMPPYVYQQDNGGGTLTNMLVVPEYQGALLNIQKKGSTDGELIIKGKDAEKIFQSLQVAADILQPDKDGVFTPGKIKNGKFIYCMEQSKAVSPNFIYYTCFIKVNLLSGLLGENKTVPTEDKSIPHLNAKYVGPNALIEPTSGKILVSFQEEDAKKLYSTLKLDESADETTFYKTGAGYGCQKIPVKKVTPVSEIIAQPAVEIKNLEETKPEEINKSEEVITAIEDKKASEEVKKADEAVAVVEDKTVTEEVTESGLKPVEVIPVEAPGMFAAYDPENNDQVIPIVKDANYNCNVFLRITDGGMFFQ